jgi:hypothetical protein
MASEGDQQRQSGLAGLGSETPLDVDPGKVKGDVMRNRPADMSEQATSGGGSYDNEAVAKNTGAGAGAGFTGGNLGASGVNTYADPASAEEEPGRPAGGALVGGGYDSAQAEAGSHGALVHGTQINPKDDIETEHSGK